MFKPNGPINSGRKSYLQGDSTMTKGLDERVEGAIEIDPGKFVLYFLIKSNLESEKIMDGVNYKREGNKIIVDIDINDVTYNRFEIVEDRFSDSYSIYDKGCFLKEM